METMNASPEIKRGKKMCCPIYGCQHLWKYTVRNEAALIKRDEYLLVAGHEELRNKLQHYYKEFFPFKEMCTWLSYGKLNTLNHKEFSYVILPKRFRRYKTFEDFREMKFEIYNVCPVKIDIGALFNMRPVTIEDKIQIAYPIERELIFDMDLSDYDTIRSCCKNAKICQKCWKFAAVAVKILNASFVEDYGWKHILWVFSGRRGIHCWICDSDARRLNAEQRRQILKYYSLAKPSLIYDDDDQVFDYKDKRLGLFSHEHMRRSYVLAAEYFVNICLNEQDVLRTPQKVSQFISLLPTKACQEKVTKLFAECSTSSEKWIKFKEYWKSEEQSQTSLWKLRPHLPKHIILYYLYPRIDVAVSVTMNHLLKAPFSFHPDTLLLCTPFDPLKVDEFNVSEVPTLEVLFNAAKFKRSSSEISPAEKIQRLRYDESRLLFVNFVKGLETTLI